MATYRELVGKNIKILSSDPSDGLDGEMWYNSTTGTLRGLAISEAWSSGAAMPTSDGIKYGAGAGTQTAGLFFGGNDNPPGTRRDETFEYNGSGWAAGGSLTAPWYLGGGMGTQTAALQAFGSVGSPVTEAFEYDGSTWTAAGDGNTGRYAVGSAGSQTAGLCFGGVSTPPTTWHALTESYNGTAWTEEGDLSTARNQVGFLGDVSTSALCIGGETPPSWATIANVEEWGGTSWTAGTAFPAATQLGVGTGSVTDGLYYGTAPSNAEAFNYDGTTWTAAANLATGRDAGARCGTGTTAALLVAGNAPTSVVLTEEYHKSTNIITAAAWASATAYPASLEQVRAAGTQTSLVAAGGETAPGPMVTTANEYNGSSWTSTTALPAARGNGAAFGTQTAGVYATGFNTSNQTTVYTYNGSAWATSPGTVNTGRRGLSGSGTSTAGIIWGGYTTTGVANTEEWNGSAMSNEPTLNTARYNPGGFGTSTATLAVCGNTPPPNADTAASEEYNGSSWTSGNNNVHALRMAAVGSGIQTDGIVFGGYDGSSTVAFTTGYDGTSWSTRPNMGTARNNHGSAQASPSVNGIAIGGGPYTNAVEEFTGETSAVNIENFTTS